MSHRWFPVLWISLPGCITKPDDSGAAGTVASAGSITVGDQTCPVDTDELIGYCLEGSSSFAVDGSGTCQEGDFRATVWLPADALSWGGNFTLQPDSTTLEDGVGAVWVDYADTSYTSTSGSASLEQRGDGTVAGTFEAQLEEFIGGAPGPSASGTVLCTLSR